LTNLTREQLSACIRGVPHHRRSLRSALDAFSRMDTVAAAQIVRDDEAIAEAYRAFVRRLVTQMDDAPLTVPAALEYLFVAKAIERIGDHVTNIAEFVVFAVKGRDVRHLPLAHPSTRS
jgi:phosphate transport system protein